jgi:hypothetical protein
MCPLQSWLAASWPCLIRRRTIDGLTESAAAASSRHARLGTAISLNITIAYGEVQGAAVAPCRPNAEKARADPLARNPMARFETEWEFLAPLTEVKLTLFSNLKFMQLIKYAILDCADVASKYCNRSIE